MVPLRFTRSGLLVMIASSAILSVAVCAAADASRQAPLDAARALMTRTSTSVPSVEVRLEDIRDRGSVVIVLDQLGRYGIERRKARGAEGTPDAPLIQAIMSDGERVWDFAPYTGGYNELPRSPRPLPKWQWLLTPWPLLGKVAELVGADPEAKAERAADGSIRVESPGQGLTLSFDPGGRLSRLRIVPSPADPDRALWQEVDYEQYQAIDAGPGRELPSVISERLVPVLGRPEVASTYRVVRWRVDLDAGDLDRGVRFDPALFGHPLPLVTDANKVSAPLGTSSPGHASLPGTGPAAWLRSPWLWLSAGVVLTGVLLAVRGLRR